MQASAGGLHKEIKRSAEKEVHIKLESSFGTVVCSKGVSDKVMVFDLKMQDDHKPNVDIDYRIKNDIGYLDISRESDVAWPLGQMRAALDRLDVDLELRGFSPHSVPALYLDSETAQERRDRRTVADTADDTWAAILGAFDDGASSRARLLLNDDNQTVRRLLEVGDPGLAAMGVESLYTRAMLMGHHALRSADLAALDRSFLGLLDRAMGSERG